MPYMASAAPPCSDGHLLNGGIPFDGIVDLSVALYESPDDPGALWFERHEAVRVDEGQFTIFLFSQVDIDPADLGVETLYLGIAVNDEAELQPRQRFGAFARSRVAFQALDVRARDINPSSLSINDQLGSTMHG